MGTPLRRSVVVALLALLVAAVVAMPTAAPAQELKFLRIGTGSTGGTYFPVGGVIANAISNPPGSRDCDVGGSCGVPGLIAAAVSTQGSVENVMALADGRLDLALSQADIAFLAYSGAGVFEATGALPDLRAIANLYPETIHLVTRADAEITAVGDLAGRRVAMGEQGSGTRVAAQIVLAAWGLGEGDVVASYDKLGRASDLLVAGELDAMFMVGGTPLAAIEHAAGLIDLRLTPIDGEPAVAIMKNYRFLMRDVVPPGAYANVPETSTLGVGAQLVVSAAADEDLIYAITRALWHPNNRRVLDAGHPKGALIRLQSALDGVAIPLHPGAARFYEEQGLTRAGVF